METTELSGWETYLYFVKVNWETITFDIVLSEDGKTITLQGGTENLSCDNRNYLKLICQNDSGSTQFSFSKHSTDNNYASFRYTRKDQTINYYYGESDEN